ncbi:hypothetical protein [Phycisphaera mikurensis]|uniref:PEP-CTERM protein-sorting domain-containing protein n=1 Tax=Phycisphaera mikurensis (strain NBRC 102666 / KCTC 22515 / FYK2301M01) TaxID=1142394 RepID=I0ICL4_PHYMF|nr:hypothetical protein [Phycisphaera mikurensis]MBB6442123.1 hypothetical protein [Phycisphaera mikurensis]BAM03002.1 hypothetical protein PSMK_08430 [Phycisphaera mikurensis NBRC 102666]
MPEPRRTPALLAVLLSASACLGQASPAAALVVAGASPTDPALADALAAMGRWEDDAAAVAVAPDWVLTTRHQGSASTVTFGGVAYTPLANTPGGPENVRNLGQDLRLVRLVDASGAPAALASTLSVATGPVTAGTLVTLGGFGPTRGGFNQDGFDWAGPLGNANGPLAGTNTLVQVGTLGPSSGPYAGMAALAAVFDEPGDAGVLPSEATVAPGDSGGFWLVGDALNGYEIAGLSHAVELRSERDNDPDPAVVERPASQAFYSQVLLAADATPFASEINAIPEPASAAWLAGGFGLLARRRRRHA